MAKSVIKVQNLSKRYRLGLKEKQAETLAGQIGNLIKSPWQNLKRLREMSRFDSEPSLSGGRDESVFWALKDVNFEVKQGEVLGIIGKNGAGKSTLLKILSQITEPTSGKIEIHGKVASLLEVGTGFHPELSGRENIYMNGTILGMTRREIDSKLDEIIDFSGVEKFIDTPVKFYSSGMKVRLGFSVAAHLEPEILIIDEVLAVGDFEFQKKCLGKMDYISKNQGRSVLFVSHNLTAVQDLCGRSILLNNGGIILNDRTDIVIKEYAFNSDGNVLIWEGFDGDDTLGLVKTHIYADGLFSRDNKLFIDVEFESQTNFKDLVVGFNIFSEFGHPLIRFNYSDFVQNMRFVKGRYKMRCLIKENVLRSGKYLIKFDLAIPNIKKVNTDISNIEFTVENGEVYRDIYNVENYSLYNSIVCGSDLVEISSI